MNKTKLYTATIERAADNGRGIAHIDGLTVFVEHALPGEDVRLVLNKIDRRVAFGRAVEILTPSRHRQTAFCTNYAHCGGCDMQHMHYAQTLVQKQDAVQSALQRIGGIYPDSYQMLPIIPMENPFQYRNKVVLAIADDLGDIRYGFFQKGSHILVPANDCSIVPPDALKAAETLVAWMKEFSVVPYDLERGRGLIKAVMLRQSKSGAALVVPISATPGVPHLDTLVERLRKALPSLKGVVLNINPVRGGETLGKKQRLLYGSETIEETVGGLRFNVSPQSFFQVNPTQMEKLYQKAIEFADLQGHETALDAYCGTGTIALLMAGRVKKVLGIEAVEAAILDARENAQKNGVANAQFLVGECEAVLPRLVEDGLQLDIATIDPPRKGCEAPLLQALIDASPKKIVYVSCNPATLARDLKLLQSGGYRLQAVQPVDMFPWTGHVECVALLSKNELPHRAN